MVATIFLAVVAFPLNSLNNLRKEKQNRSQTSFCLFRQTCTINLKRQNKSDLQTHAYINR